MARENTAHRKAWALATVERVGTMMIDWRPIAEARKDGTSYLLWYDGPADVAVSGAIQGWWFSSPKGTDDGWETTIGFVGEPSMFAEVNFPE
jgi:hypothetical protein